MAPIRPRYSIKTYVGKKQAKQSLSYVPEVDPFDMLCQGGDKQGAKSNIFESSSERENSIPSRTPDRLVENVGKSYSVLHDTFEPSPLPVCSNVHQRINRGSGSVKKRKRSLRNSVNKVLKKIDKSDIIGNTSNQYEVKSSTPKLQKIGTRFRQRKSSNLLSSKKSFVYSPSNLSPYGNNYFSTDALSPIIKTNVSPDIDRKDLSSSKRISYASAEEELSSDGSLTSKKSLDASTPKKKHLECSSVDRPETSLVLETSDRDNEEVSRREGSESGRFKSLITSNRKESSTSSAYDSPCQPEISQADQTLSNSKSDSSSIFIDCDESRLSSITDTFDVPRTSPLEPSSLVPTGETSKVISVSTLSSGDTSISDNEVTEEVSVLSKFHRKYLECLVEDSNNGNLPSVGLGETFHRHSLEDSSSDIPVDNTFKEESVSPSVFEPSLSTPEVLAVRKRRNLRKGNSEEKSDQLSTEDSSSDVPTDSKSDEELMSRLSLYGRIKSTPDNATVRKRQNLKKSNNEQHYSQDSSRNVAKESKSNEELVSSRLPLIPAPDGVTVRRRRNLKKSSIEQHSSEDSSSNVPNENKSIEEVMARLSLVEPTLSPPEGVTIRKRRNLNQFRRPVIDEPSSLETSQTSVYGESNEGSYGNLSRKKDTLISSPNVENRHGRRTDVDRRQIYQRLSRSLPASFKDSKPLFFERGCVSDIDLRKTKTMLLSCSTRSLPAVLEESSNDKEMQSCHRGVPYRKSSLDHNHTSSPLFLGFSTAEIGKRRPFIMKKHSDDSSCTSPHTLPVLPENDSDSSCDSGDDSKRLESGSSSLMESPVMSPGMQGSPSRRDNSRISAGYSSETSLSSKSEGMLSPLQEDTVTPPRSSSPDIAAASSEEDSGSSPIRKEDQIRRRRSSRLTSRRTLGYIAEESEADTSELSHLPDSNNKGFFLMTGKKYRRSLAIIHNHIMGEESFSYENKGKNYLETVDTIRQLQKEDYSHFDSDDSSDLSPDSRKSLSFNRTCLSRVSSNFSTAVHSEDSHSSQDSSSTSFRTVVPRQSRYSTLFCVNSNIVDVSEAFSRITMAPEDNTIFDASFAEKEYTAESAILGMSHQEELWEFREIFADGSLDTWKKIGEGVYSEVFSLSRNENTMSVLKIIPVEGDIIINGCTQMTLNENLSEVLISKHLSELRGREDYACEGFVQLLKVWYVKGSYPEELISLWNEFNDDFGSDNDRPTIFPQDQKYLCLELANSGRALESFTFSTARQSFSVFKQIVFSLAVAEAFLEFEHRDLHWGNILVDKTKEKKVDFILNGDVYSLATNGVKSTVIDYTWSSMTLVSCDNMRICNDMEMDPEIFMGKGDLQFDTYRQMREDVQRDWSRFIPKTNVRWLYYLADKLLHTSKYLRPTTATHKDNQNSFRRILEVIPSCDNSLQVAMEVIKYK